MLFFSGCRNVKKNVSQSSSETTTEITSQAQGTQLVNMGSAEAIELTTFSSENEQFDFEISGPAEILPDGTIKSTSENTTIKGKQNTKKTEEITEKSNRSDSIIFKLDTGSNRVEVASTKEEEKEKEVERSVSWVSYFLGISVLIGIVVIVYFWLKGFSPSKFFR